MLTDESDALMAALVEIERHVGATGWDQPARLFALVRTDELMRAEPSLAEHLRVTFPDALSSIEQDDFHGGEDLLSALSRLQWPATVIGCALSVERAFLPADEEAGIPADPDLAARHVAEHPRREEIRVVVGALRSGEHAGLARLVSQPDELLSGTDLVPALSRALAETLK